ncbi:MAG: hypothetical protein JOZ56_02210 [Actinobacteria bacterium]|nr:hypothetical protein [Actinomycetota bacterium]MBV8561882.1 hypothetical protein [Actinomycetota bacterium]
MVQSGVVAAFAQLLALAKPEAFRRAERLQRYVLELACELGVEDTAPLEAAALLSQIGALTLPETTCTRIYHGAALSHADLELVSELPAIAAKIAREAPELDEVRQILSCVEERFARGVGHRWVYGQDIPLGARLLKIAHDFDLLEAQERSVEFALSTMRGRAGWYDPELLELFAALRGSGEHTTTVKELLLRDLRPGMVFAADIHSETEGVLLVARGREATKMLLERLLALPEGLVAEPVRVLVREPVVALVEEGVAA